MSQRYPGVTGIVLAAGLSRRAAPDNKLLLPFGNSTVVRSTAAAMAGVGFGELLVATGHQHAAVEAALAGLPVRVVFAADFACGMGRTLAAAVRHSSLDTRAWVVTPGDLPHLTAALVEKIVACATVECSDCHVIPTDHGKRGHPVVLGGWLRDRLLRLVGDEGARGILASPPEAGRRRFLEVRDGAIRRDVDAPEAAANRAGGDDS